MLQFLKSIPVTLVLAFAALVCFFMPSVAATLEFQTQASPLMQLPQWFSCHLLHWSSEHLFWDLGMFVVLAALCERINRNAFLVMTLLSAALIPPLVGMFYPAIETYRGLSGIDTALYAMLSINLGMQRWREKDHQGVLLFTGLLAAMFFKIGHELFAGNTFFVESTVFLPLPIAHVVGAVVGIVVAVAYEFGNCSGPHVITVHGIRAIAASCSKAL